MNAVFTLDDEKSYQRWKIEKLAGYPERAGDLVVPIENPFDLTVDDRRELLARIAKANMAVYQGPTNENPDKNIPISIMSQLGAERRDFNPEGDELGVTSLTPRKKGEFKSAQYEYIPYSSHAIKWHTDGYYNTMERQVRSLILHCVSQADEGGENDVMDHEIMYILLRDKDPGHIRALMEPDAMTIPKRVEEGKVIRGDMPGPVFSILPDSGRLHMRYTHRTRSIAWKETKEVGQAVAALRDILTSPSPYKFRLKLQPGWGVVCNNVLHTREAFEIGGDRPDHRLLYRVRYLDSLG
ncbi:FIG00779168: hypothetical protein [hydrothermal vent metagenome]|uniref:TauD/TfdA-like domain-containing protein n=1 Tax=hydrothermal vent metagenome TaxID=652676 RepID=A0A3B1D208_9ZZZZ